MKTITKSFIAALTVSAISLPLSAEQYRSGRNYDNATTLDYAKVVNVEPIIETYQVNNPVRECWDERVQRNSYQKSKSYTPEVFGAIVGAAVGNRFGHGSGRDAATVAGALLGTSVARDMKHRHVRNYGQNNGRYDVVQRCEMRDSYTTDERVVGYDVAYKYRGNVFHTQTDSHPGKKIRVRVIVEPA